MATGLSIVANTAITGTLGAGATTITSLDMTGDLYVNSASLSAFLIEQDGVHDNTLIVDRSTLNPNENAIEVQLNQSQLNTLNI